MRLITILLIILSINSFSETISLRKGENLIRLRSTQLNGADYIYTNDIVRYVFPNSTYDKRKNEIINPAYTLKFQPGNLYLIMQDWEGSRIIQMELPTAEHRNRVYLPAKAFLNGLDSLDIFTISSNSKESLFTIVDEGETLLKPLAKYKPKRSVRSEPAIIYDSEGRPNLINLNKTDDPFSETFEENSALLYEFLEELNSVKETYIDPTENEQNSIDSSIPKEIYNSSESKPTPYFLPEDLIREELEEVREGKR